MADIVVLFVLERLVELKNIVEQVGILLRKNFILSIRRWPWTLVQILAPVGIVALLIGLSFLTEGMSGNFGLNDYVYPLSTPLGEFPACKSFGGLKCISFAYAPNNDPTVDKIIAQMVAAEPTLSGSTMAFASEQALLEYVHNNPNTTYSGAAFTVTPSPMPPAGSIIITYNVLYNATYPLMSAYVSSAIDNAILMYSYEDTNGVQWQSGKPIEIQYKGYPKPPYPMDGQMMIFSQVGPQFFSLAIMITFISTLHSIVLEREYRLRIGMTVMGLKGVSYWISWFITAAIMTVLTTIATLIAGYAMFVDLFWGCNVLVLFTVFFIYGISLVVLAFVLSTLVSAGRNALILGFIILGVSYLLNFVLANGSLVYMLWMDSVSPIWRSIFVWYPPFNFAKAFTDISTKASKVFSPTERTFVDGPGYGVLDFFKPITYSFVDVDETGKPIANYNMDVPPAYVSMLWLFANSIVFILVAWYLDNLLNEAVGTRNPLFFLMPSFWGFNISGFKTHQRVTAVRNTNDARLKSLNSFRQGQTTTSPSTGSPGDMDEDVLHEAIAAAEGNVYDTNVGLRIINLHKKFNPFWGLFSHPGRLLMSIHKSLSRKIKFLSFLDNAMKNLWQPVHAVHGLNLRMEDGTCLALLGHNGAGKTTTMMLLNGLRSPTKGDAFMYGLSIRTNLQDIRRRIGVCPQDNILWPELTAREHLYMFCQFKRISSDKINAEIDARLKDVGLFEVGKHRVSSYSGGMKRRLSVAIAFIGQPRMVLLDEPTTGMDPHSKRQVWQLIHDMKKGRMLLLTTHSMEEADALADRIGIMSDGHLKCIGDSVHLKNKYGAGYNLSIVSTMSRVKDLIQIVQNHVPDAELASENAGAVVYNVPRTAVQALGSFIEFLENNQVKIKSKKHGLKSSSETIDQISPTEQTSQQDHLVLDWGISHTTLEDVYLKVTHADHHASHHENGSAAANGSTLNSPAEQPLKEDQNTESETIFGNIETVAIPENSHVEQPIPAEPISQTAPPMLPPLQPEQPMADALLVSPSPLEGSSEHETQPAMDLNTRVDQPGSVDTSPLPPPAAASSSSQDDSQLL